MRRLPWLILAVLGPLFVLGGAGRALTAQREWTASDTVQLMDQRLTATPGLQVLVVGPSIAGTDIDAHTLGAGVGDPPLVTLRLSQARAPAPVWYTILRERVYAHGYRPMLVVLVGTMESLLTNRPASSLMSSLTQHFAEPDSVILRKTLGSAWPAWVERAVAARGELREPVLSLFRDAPAGLFFGDGTKPSSTLVSEAGEAALGADHGPMAARTLPVVDQDGGESQAVNGLVTPAESYLPEIAALVAAHGGRLAVVLPPTSTRRPAGFRVSAELEEASVKLANQLGVAWVDLRAWTRSDGDFRDGLHLSAEAAPRFTAEVARQLVAVNALGPGAPVPASAPPPGASRSRSGGAATLNVAVPAGAPGSCSLKIPMPAFAALSDGALRPLAAGLAGPFLVREGGDPLYHGNTRDNECSGRYNLRSGVMHVSRRAAGGEPVSVEVDAASNWVWPGSGLTWRFEGTWNEPAPGSVEAEVVLVEPGGGGASVAAPVLRIGSRTVPITGSEARRSVSVDFGADSPPESVSVEMPEGGAWAVVRRLRVRVGAAEASLVEPALGARHDLVVSAQFDPNPVPTLPTGPFNGGVTSRRLPAPWTDHSSCPPILVLEDGVPMPASPWMGAWIPVKPEDGSDPYRNGRTYTLAIREERICKGTNPRFLNTRVWMYPADRFTGAVLLPSGAAPIRALRLQAVPTQAGGGGTLHAVLRAGGVIRFDETVPVAELEVEREFPLEVPLSAAQAGEVTVEATLSPDAGPVLLSWFGLED